MSEHGQLQVVEKFQSGLLLRDYSGRLTFELFNIPGESYDLKKKELAQVFHLKRWGFTVHGFDESFQSFRKGTQRISIEWDIWSGLTIVAKNVASEALITEIVGYFETQAESNQNTALPILEQQKYRNQLIQWTQSISEFKNKNTASGLMQCMQSWHHFYLKAKKSGDHGLNKPVYSIEEKRVLNDMQDSCALALKEFSKQTNHTIEALQDDVVKACIQNASDAYFLLLQRGRFSECIVCF